MPALPVTETTRGIERRLLRWMGIAGIAGVATTSALMGARFAAGVAAGGLISVLGYAWLLEALARALEPGAAKPTKAMVIKLILRYPVLLGTLYLFYRTKWLPVGALLAGLFVPLAGGVVECLYQLGGTVRRGHT